MHVLDCLSVETTLELTRDRTRDARVIIERVAATITIKLII